MLGQRAETQIRGVPTTDVRMEIIQSLVSTSNGNTPSSTWMEDQVFAVELVPGGRVARLAHTHSVYDENIEHDYWAEPHASVNRDFTRIVFTSNWGKSGSDRVEMYMIHLPEDWISSLP